MSTRDIIQAAAGASGPATYVEDVFSTYLYDGTGATQTITNGIDLSTKGGLVWIKQRTTASQSHSLFDTTRGVNKLLESNSTVAQNTGYTDLLTQFNTNGFTVGADAVTAGIVNNSGKFVSWTFRNQAKFFDIVSYTGNGSNRTINHNLGSTPGCIIIKRTDSTGDWITYHRSLGSTDFIKLNGTAATSADSGAWNNTDPTSTTFSLGTGNTNVSGGTYVAYLFAHNAGGFGASGLDNVISCGSVTSVSTGTISVNLGFEPQFILYKPVNSVGSWVMQDNMRGMPTITGTTGVYLSPNTSAFEQGAGNLGITATGFDFGSGTNNTWIYIAIRRPMKVPTSGTSVFTPIARAGTGATATITSGFVTDLSISQIRSGSALGAFNGFFDRLRGATNYLSSNTTDAEITYANSLTSFASNTGITVGADSASGAINYSGTNYAEWMFQRAPGFFDVVCYTGTGVARTVAHNLGFAPELIIVKRRNGAAEDWYVYHTALGTGNFINLDLTAIPTSSNQAWNNTVPTASVFTVGTLGGVNSSTNTFVAYIFASCPGVSKVGSYTGTGATQTISCGFTGGARFVLVKRTDSTGDWYVWDSARGIVAANDPHLSLNTTAAEVTTDDSIDPDSTGFIVNQVAATNINVSSATYIYLAIA